jgi:hypothetical protein
MYSSSRAAFPDLHRAIDDLIPGDEKGGLRCA